MEIKTAVLDILVLLQCSIMFISFFLFAKSFAIYSRLNKSLPCIGNVQCKNPFYHLGVILLQLHIGVFFFYRNRINHSGCVLLEIVINTSVVLTAIFFIMLNGGKVVGDSYGYN